jgi:hypothetical protein
MNCNREEQQQTPNQMDANAPQIAAAEVLVWSFASCRCVVPRSTIQSHDAGEDDGVNLRIARGDGTVVLRVRGLWLWTDRLGNPRC